MDIGFLTDLLIHLLLGLGIGFITGLTGMGAAVLVVPSLVIHGLPAISAVGTGAFYSMLARAHATYEHLRLGTVRRRTAFYIILGGVPASLIASFVITYLAKTSGSRLDFALKIAIIVVILITWGLMVTNIIKSYKNGPKNYYIPPKRFPQRRKLYGIAAGFVTGILIGSTSIGGGVLIVPILVTLFQLSPNNTVGTSTMISVAMSAASASAYLLGGRVDLPIAITMFIGGIPGVLIGTRLTVRIPHRFLEIILFTVVTVSVILMLVGIKH